MARGAKVSAEMMKARKMITDSGGKASAYSVAIACGLTTGAITRSQWYADYMASVATSDETPMQRAQRLVVVDGKTAYAAAKMTGLAQSTISRAQWYREHQLKGTTC